MKLAVSKNNEFVDSYDFSSEIRELESQEFSCFIGRAESCLIQLEDYKISREHAQLSYSKGVWQISNISHIGLFLINGSPVQEKALVNGDIITIGDYSIIAFISAEAAPVAADIPNDLLAEFEETSDIQIESINDANLADSTEDSSEENSETTKSEFLEEDEEDAEEELTAGIKNDYDDFDTGTGTDSSSEKYDEYNEYENKSLVYSEDGSDSGFDEDSTKVFSGFTKVHLELFGENIPFEKYELNDGECFIGRDPEKCQIVLNDPEVSSIHVKINKNSVLCSIKDMGSANGILLNGARIETGDLVNGDEFIIGSTTFTYLVSSSFFKEAAGSLMPVDENQVIEVEEIVEIDEDDPEFADLEISDDSVATGGGGLFTKEALKDPARRKKLIYIIVGLLLLIFFLGGDSDKPKKKEKKKDEKKSNALVKKNKMKSIIKGKKDQKPLTPEQTEFVEATYQVAQQRLAENAYQEAVLELDKIFSMVENYKQARTIYDVAKNGLAKLEELEKKKQEEIDNKIRLAKVETLLKKARKSVANRELEVSAELFNQILGLDPENIDVLQLRRELKYWQMAKEKKELEKVQKEAERKRKVSQLSPAKSLFIQKKWNVAIIAIAKFLSIKDMDEDLTKEATTMLETSKKTLEKIIAPMLGRARSLKEGQDLKGAYEVYKEILEFDPGNKEAAKERADIKSILTLRSRRVYRKALISESLSLFPEAKELYQEVQQISPSDSEYYYKASDKLKEYWEH